MMDNLEEEVNAISERMKHRVVSAYEAVSSAWLPKAKTATVTLTAMQCATILSSLSSGYKESFGEALPGSPPLPSLVDTDLAQ